MTPDAERLESRLATDDLVVGPVSPTQLQIARPSIASEPRIWSGAVIARTEAHDAAAADLIERGLLESVSPQPRGVLNALLTIRGAAPVVSVVHRTSRHQSAPEPVVCCVHGIPGRVAIEDRFVDDRHTFTLRNWARCISHLVEIANPFPPRNAGSRAADVRRLAETRTTIFSTGPLVNGNRTEVASVVWAGPMGVCIEPAGSHDKAEVAGVDVLAAVIEELLLRPVQGIAPKPMGNEGSGSARYSAADASTRSA